MIQQNQFPFSGESKIEGNVSILGTLLLIGSIAVTFILVNNMAIKDSIRRSNDTNQ